MPDRRGSAALRAAFAGEHYTAAEVAALLRITPRAVGRRRAAGRLRGVPRPGGARGWLYPRAEVDQIVLTAGPAVMTCPGCGAEVTAAEDGGLPPHPHLATGRSCNGRAHGTTRR